MLQKNEKFKYDSIAISELIQECKSGILKIPRIQRNLVWKPKQKKDLQNSLMQGYPVGVILFATISGQKYIVDGLQRTITIMSIFINMFENMETKDLERIISDSIEDTSSKMALGYTANEKEWLGKIIEKEIKLNDPKMSIKDPRDSDEFGELFAMNQYQNISKSNEKFQKIHIKEIASKIHRNSSNELGIENYKLPYIQFDGSINETIHLFKLINQQGTKLENHDIWKSQWSIIKMDFEDQKIIHKINNKSDTIPFDILGIKSEKIKDLSPFDVIWYIFDEFFSSDWSHHISKAFSGKKDNKESNKKIIGFNSLISLIKLHIILEESSSSEDDFDDEKIGEKFKKIISKKEDVDVIIDLLKRSRDLFDKIFNSFSFYKGNKIENNSNSEFLPEKSYIIVILGTIYKYIHKQNKKLDDSVDKKYKDCFIKHYIVDLLSGTFKASSTKIAFSIISKNNYLEPMENDELKREIEKFYSENLKITSKTFDRKSTTLMAYLFMEDITIKENDRNLYQNDHLIPLSKLEKNGIFKGCSSFANLSLLTKEENQEKSDSIELKYLHKDKIYRWAKVNETSLADKLENKYIKITEELTEENYKSFLNTRKAIIMEMYSKK